MDNKMEICSLIKCGANINIIGDSLAAGGGSSENIKTQDTILIDGKDVYVKRVAPNSWWGKFKTYLDEKFPCCILNNNGCGGIYSSQVRENLVKLYKDEDDIIIILLGANDRKIENGMNELYENLTYIVKHLKNKGKQVVLLTPNPSNVSNESYPNRIFHLEDVANIISIVALKEEVLLVNNFNYIQEYLFITGKKIDDIIFGDGCSNDGLHPSDEVQYLMFRNLIYCLDLSLKVENATW